MGFLYFLIEVLKVLQWVLFIVLAVGFPIAILWRIYARWGNAKARLFWLAVALIWVLPNVVEFIRDTTLNNWIAELPPAPVVALEQDAVIALNDGGFDAAIGLAGFRNCLEDHYAAPLCDFLLGPAITARGLGIALPQNGGWARLNWARQDTCDVHLRYNQMPTPISEFLVAQGMCPGLKKLDATAPTYVATHLIGHLPLIRATKYGQIALTPVGAAKPVTTLTSFSVDRPLYPVLWGVHWLPLFKSMTPKRTWELNVGARQSEETVLAYPKTSLHYLAYARGWQQSNQDDKSLLAQLVKQYGYTPNRALPALRSDSFFPVTFTMRVVCSDLLRNEVTPEIMAQIRRIKDSNVRYNNTLPTRLATEAIESGCGAGL